MAKGFDFARYLNMRSAYSPIWLWEGNRLAFLTDVTGTPQVWAVDLEENPRGNWPEQLTYFQEKVWSLSAAPDSSKFICTRDIGGNELYQLFLVTADGTEVTHISSDTSAIYHFGGWSADGKRIAFACNSRNGTHFDIYIQEISAGSSKMIYQSEGSFRVAAWNPDRSSLLVVHEISSSNQPLFELNIATGELRSLSTENLPANNHHISWSKNGNIYLLTNEGQDFTNVAKISLANGERTYLTNHAWDIEALTVSSDGNTLAYILNENGYGRLHLYDIAAGITRRVDNLPDGVITEPSFSPNGKFIAAAVQSPQENLNIWTIDSKTLACQKATHSSLAGIPQDSFVSPELIHYKTFDNRLIPAFFYRPPKAKPPYPVILYVHGGPASQVLPDFDPRFQFFLSKGYAILATNVRGSSGYGKAYMALDDVELRMDSVADLKFAVDWLHQSGEAAPDRIAIYGRSYGGFMVLAAVTTYPNLWAAAIDVVGIANWVTFLENTGTWRRAHREKEYGSLTNDREFLASISPIYKVDDIQAPMMVIHGSNDPRVPVSEADQIVAALAERGHPVEYLRYEDEGHKIAKLANRIDSFTKMAAFLEKHC